MIAIGRIDAAYDSNTDELLRGSSTNQSWLRSDSTLLAVTMSRCDGSTEEILATLNRSRFIAVGPDDAEDDGVVFSLRLLCENTTSSDTITFMMETDSVISIEPDNLVGGRVFVWQDDLDAQQVELIAALSSDVPLVSNALSIIIGDDEYDVGSLPDQNYSVATTLFSGR